MSLESLEMTEPSLEELTLDLGDLSLDRSILTSSDPLLISMGQDIAEDNLKEFIFAISLLGATIQGGGTRERSDGGVFKICFILNKFIFCFVF